MGTNMGSAETGARHRGIGIIGNGKDLTLFLYICM